jgi:ribokinase
MSTALVVGSANADLVYSVSEFPQPGQTITSKNFNIFAGGKGANQAVACARAGANVEFCACIGTDSFGDFLFDSIKGNSVGMEYTTVVLEPTGSAVIFVNSNGENQIVLNPSANHALSHASVTRAISLTNADILLVQLEIPSDAVRAVLESNVRAILNPAPYRNLSEFKLDGLYAITPNETECAELSGIQPDSEQSAKEAAKAILAMGIQNVIITLGSRGCYWTNGTEECFVTPPRVTPVDTTGAGDVFNGALVARLLENDDFPTALKFAVKAASISTTRPGALESAPTLKEVEQFGL